MAQLSGVAADMAVLTWGYPWFLQAVRAGA
jgi:hypothetical protein